MPGVTSSCDRRHNEIRESLCSMLPAVMALPGSQQGFGCERRADFGSSNGARAQATVLSFPGGR